MNERCGQAVKKEPAGGEYDRFDRFEHYRIFQGPLPPGLILEPRTLYITIYSYGIEAVHFYCPCGCGWWVSLPQENIPEGMTRGWNICINGKHGVTLGDDKGNCVSGYSVLNHPCKAHFFIENSRVRWLA